MQRVGSGGHNERVKPICHISFRFLVTQWFGRLAGLGALVFVAITPASSTAGGTDPRAFVYAVSASASGNSIVGFATGMDGSLNPVDGRITPTGSSAFPAIYYGGDIATVSPTRGLVFVANSGGNGVGGLTASISVFRIDRKTGVLSVVPGSPFRTDAFAGDTVSLVVSPDGKTLYASHFWSGAIAIFSVSDDGVLSKLDQSPVRSLGRMRDIWSLAISPDGRYLAACLYLSGQIAIYRIEPDGSLKVPEGRLYEMPDFSRPVRAAFDPTGRFLFVRAFDETDTNAVASFSFSADGDLAPTPRALKLLDGNAGSGIYVTANGRSVVLPDPELLNIRSYAIAPDGSLGADPLSTLSFGVVPVNLTFDRSGAHAYAIRSDRSIEVFSIEADGRLSRTNLPLIAVPGSGLAYSVVVWPGHGEFGVGCPEDLTTVADQRNGSALGRLVFFETPTTTSTCEPTSVVCEPPSGSFFALGTTQVTCEATNSCLADASCSFAVLVAPPNGLCAFDQVSGDTFFQVIEPESPVFGWWSYKIGSTGETISAVADTTTVSDDGTYRSRMKNDARFRLSAKGNLASGSVTVKVKDRILTRTLKLSDSNAQIGACSSAQSR